VIHEHQPTLLGKSVGLLLGPGVGFLCFFVYMCKHDYLQIAAWLIWLRHSSRHDTMEANSPLLGAPLPCNHSLNESSSMSTYLQIAAWLVWLRHTSACCCQLLSAAAPGQLLPCYHSLTSSSSLHTYLQIAAWLIWLRHSSRRDTMEANSPLLGAPLPPALPDASLPSEANRRSEADSCMLRCVLQRQG
jgi:hypothetical protein